MHAIKFQAWFTYFFLKIYPVLDYLLTPNCFSPTSMSLGVEFGSKIIPVGGKTVKLQIWDTGI